MLHAVVRVAEDDLALRQLCSAILDDVPSLVERVAADRVGAVGHAYLPLATLVEIYA